MPAHVVVLLLRGNDKVMMFSKDPTNTVTRFAHIDALRGMAAIMVIVFHCCYSTVLSGVNLSSSENTLINMFVMQLDLGKIGVIVFFIVSGFVIPPSLLKNTRNPISDFVIGRLFRMYPAYWLSIPAGIYAIYIMSSPLPNSNEILINATMLQQFFGVDNIIGLYWTLQIEIVFYTCCVLIFICGGLNNDRVIAIAAVFMIIVSLVAAFLKYKLEIGLPVALSLSLSIMFLGFLYRSGVVDGRSIALHYLLFVGAFFVVMLPIVCFLGYRAEEGVGASWQRYLFSYYVAIIVFLVFNRFPIRGSFFTYIGKISYSIYLFGAVIQVIIERNTYVNDMPLPMFALIATTIFSTIIVAIPIYHFVEATGIAAGRRIARRLDRARPARPDLDVI